MHNFVTFTDIPFSKDNWWIPCNNFNLQYIHLFHVRIKKILKLNRNYKTLSFNDNNQNRNETSILLHELAHANRHSQHLEKISTLLRITQLQKQHYSQENTYTLYKTFWYASSYFPYKSKITVSHLVGLKKNSDMRVCIVLKIIWITSLTLLA